MSKSKKIKPSQKLTTQANEMSISPAQFPQQSAEPKISKKALMLEMLQRPEGATLAELEQATGWQTHSVRGALVNLKNKDKQPILNSKDENGPRRYFLKLEEGA